jgi:hypothetical protein
MKTKKGEKEKLRVKILEKAIAYFKVHGTGGAGIADLMKHAGQTTGALKPFTTSWRSSSSNCFRFSGAKASTRYRP